MRNAIRYSDRYYQMLQAWTKRPSRFDKPCPMKIFTYKGERDTVLTPRLDPPPQADHACLCSVAMDPRSGYVKAYVGGPNFRYFKYDMAKQGKRQIGSTIKPFVPCSRHRPPGTESLHARTEPAGDDRNRQRGVLGRPRRPARSNRTARCTPELGPGP